MAVEIRCLLDATIFYTEQLAAEHPLKGSESKEDNMFMHLIKIRLYIMNPDESYKLVCNIKYAEISRRPISYNTVKVK